MLFQPGERFHYSNTGIAMLSYAVTAALKESPEKDIRSLLRKRVMRPMGVPDEEWSVGYGRTFNVDDLPLVAAWGGGNYTARAVARVARLMLRQGNWEGRQLISRDVVREITSDAGTPGNCGMGWWSNNDGSGGCLPKDAFWGSGAGDQMVLVVPSLNLVAVRNGERLHPSLVHAEALRTCLFEPLIEAITDRASTKSGGAPYPPSPLIRDIRWAPKETILLSQLAWSEDHGKSWSWSYWKFATSFCCPTFLNYGKNYVGARDDFVYVYSHDHDSAYQPANRFVLARVPKNQLKSYGAYEFFKGITPQGEAVWTKDISQRSAVFTHHGNCYRSGITYNAALKRYFWCQILPSSKHPHGPRFQGGFGIYDAPEPWGPWTTGYFTQEWDVGPGETSSLPSKWMGSNGKSMHLVFSGDDHFSVRKAVLLLHESSTGAQGSPRRLSK